MQGIEFMCVPEEGAWCAECGRGMRKGQFCCRLFGQHYLCSDDCAESFRENWVGRDFVAAHDQVVDSRSLRRLVAGCPNASLFIDREQGHGWNQAAVQRQLGIMLAFFSGAAPATEGLEAVA